jgi:2'-5' RNA ligase
MEQLSLFGEAEGRPPLPPPFLERDVLFYALLLGPRLWRPASRLVTAQRDRHGLTGKMRPSDTFHISVLGFGFMDELRGEDIALAHSIANSTAFQPFDLEFPELLSFGGKRKADAPAALVLRTGAGTERVHDLAARLTISMIAHGMRPRSFKPDLPHLTLLYDTIRIPPTPLDPPITTEITGFSLVHSHRGKGKYSVLWP